MAVNPQVVEQVYEIERLQREIQLLKDSLSNYIRLEVDFRESERENRRLQAQLDKLHNVEIMNVLLMKQCLSVMEERAQL